MTRDYSSEQKKVRAFHQAVMQKVDELLDNKTEHLKAARRGQTSTERVTPALKAQRTPATEDVSESTRQVYTDFECSNKRIHEFNQAVNQMSMEQGRKKRQMYDKESALYKIKCEAKAMEENCRKVQGITSQVRLDAHVQFCDPCL